MKYICCGFVHHGINFEHHTNEIKICCQASHSGGGNIVLLKDFDPKNVDIKELISNRRKILAHFRNGEIYPNCNGCMELKEWDVPISEPKLKILMLQYWTKCNSNCIYCYTANDKKYYNTKKNYNFYPILKKLIQEDIIDKNGIANFSGGEVSCLKEFKKVVKLLNTLNYFIVINTSGVKYEKIIEERLKKGNSCIVISVDAGSKAIFEKIKRVKTFDKVWKNIAKYAKNQSLSHLVNIKYIIIPGINDNEQEINLWLDNCKKAGVHNVILGIDANYFEPNRNNIAPHIFDLFNKTRQKAEDMGFCFYIANRATTMLTKGKYADPFWEKYRYDESPYTNFYFEKHRI